MGCKPLGSRVWGYAPPSTDPSGSADDGIPEEACHRSLAARGAATRGKLKRLVLGISVPSMSGGHCLLQLSNSENVLCPIFPDMFYNPKRRHGSNGGAAPVEFERQAVLSGS